MLFVINTFVQFLGPTAIVAIGIQHTVVTVDITRSGIVPISVTAKTKREPYGVPFFQPRLSRFGAHLPMGVLPCGDGDCLCAACSRFVALAALFIATASR